MSLAQHSDVTMNTKTLLAAALVIATTLLSGAAAPSPAPSTPAPRRSEWFSCPASQRVHADLDSWARLLEGGPAASAVDSLLAQLQLRPALDLRGETPAPACAPGETPKLVAVDIIPVDLSEADDADRVVRVRFESCTYAGHGEPLPLLSHRVQVLRPLGDGEWCALGDDLSIDQPAWDLPCEDRRSDDRGARVRELDFENVVDPRRKTMRVLDHAGACEDTEAYAEHRVSYWDASGTKLQRIFHARTFAVDGLETTAKVGSISLAGEFPKRIVVTEQERCLAAGEFSLPAPDCAEDAPARRTWSFRAGTYRLE